MTKSRILLAVAALVVVAAGLSFSQWTGGQSVESALVRRDTIVELIDEQAKTRLPETQLVTMPYAARIEPIALDEGARVEKGQVVAQIVQRDLDLQVNQAEAAYERLEAAYAENADTSVEDTSYKQALAFVTSMTATVAAARERVKSGKAKLDYAQGNFERIKSLRPSGAKSLDDEERALLLKIESEVEYRQDELILAAIEATQTATGLMPTLVMQYIGRKSLTGEVWKKQQAEALAALEQAKVDRQRGTMLSPVDGVVLERYDSNERYVAAGTVLLRIGELDRLEVESEVLTQDVGNVKPGDTAEVYGPAIGGRLAVAAVDRIFPAGFTKISSLGVEQQRVKVILKFTPEELKRLRDERRMGVEYRVRVRIITAKKDDALIVPRSALFRGPGGGWQVFAIRGGEAKLQDVKIGLLNDEIAEVVEGLSDDEEVILAPESTIDDGTRVSGSRRD
ncbi:MAG: efflux RND transporter periplasmic adaptor subunit [Pirellulales bacterium]